MKKDTDKKIGDVIIASIFEAFHTETIVVCNKAYRLSYDLSWDPTGGKCKICGKKKEEVWFPYIFHLYFEVYESEAIPINLLEEENEELAKEIIKKLRRHIKKFNPPSCDECIDKMQDTIGEELS